MAKILIADDEAPMREMMGLACKLDGHEVHLAYDTPSTLSAYERVDPDLLLLDLYMPGGGGAFALKQLRLSRPGRVCPVVIVTGYIADMDEEARENLAASSIIEKPFNLEVLRHAIRTALSGG
jgi:two-component system response regulator RegX3